MAKDISVVIPCLNEWPLVLFTVQSCFEELRQSGADFEIIVVDNLSQDGMRDTFDEIKIPADMKPHLRWLEYTSKHSHWQAFNLAVKESSSRLLFFLDAHCTLSRGCLVDMMHDFYQIQGPVGALHARIRFMFAGKDSTPKDRTIDRERFCYGYATPKASAAPYPVKAASTCAMMVPRVVFDELGGWPEGLGCWGGGEQYFVWRNWMCGYPHYVHPTAYVWHPWRRGRNYKPDPVETARNFLMAAYCLGGQNELDRLAVAQKGIQIWKERSIRFDDIPSICTKEAKRVAELRRMTLTEFFDSKD